MTQLLQVQSPGGTHYSIDFDGLNYTVLRQMQNQKTGELYWKHVGGSYYARLANACKALLEVGLLEQDHQQVMTLVWRMDAWAKKIEAAVAEMEVQRAQVG